MLFLRHLRNCFRLWLKRTLTILVRHTWALFFAIFHLPSYAPLNVPTYFISLSFYLFPSNFQPFINKLYLQSCLVLYLPTGDLRRIIVSDSLREKKKTGFKYLGWFWTVWPDWPIFETPWWQIFLQMSPKTIPWLRKSRKRKNCLCPTIFNWVLTLTVLLPRY